MAAVHVGIGHDDDLVIAETAEVHVLFAGFVFLRHAHAEGGVDILDLLAVECTAFSGLLHVQDLASQRQDGLVAAVASLLGGAACGVTLDEEKFALLGIILGAVRKFTGQACACHDCLALNHLTSLACSSTCGSGEHDLIYDSLCEFRILFQINIHGGGGCLRNRGRDLGIAEFGLGLALELRLGDLDGDNCSKALAEILGGKFYLRLLQKFVLIGVVLQRTAETHLEALQMRSAFDGVDVIHVRIDLLGITGIVLESDIYGDNLVG